MSIVHSYCQQVVKVIWHKAASLPHMDGSIVLTMWRQYAPDRHSHYTGFVPCWVALSISTADLSWHRPSTFLFLKSNFVHARFMRVKMGLHSEFHGDPWTIAELWRFNSFFKMVVFRHLGFFKVCFFKPWLMNTVQTVNVRHAKVHGDWSNSYWDMAIFDFSKRRPSAILDF